MGWNGSDGKVNYPRHNKNKKNSKVLICGVVFVVLALLGILFVGIFRDEDSKNSTDDLKSSLSTPANLTKTDNKSDETGSNRSNNGHSQNQRPSSSSSKTPGVEKEIPELKLDNLPTPPPPPLQKSHFTEATDQVISMVINTEDAIAPVPLGPNFDNEFKKSLATKIVINDDDPEDVKEAKRNVIAVRQELKALIADGKSPREALEAHRAEINKIFEARSMVVQEAAALRDKEGEESAAEFLKLANDYLESKGYEKVRLRERPQR